MKLSTGPAFRAGTGIGVVLLTVVIFFVSCGVTDQSGQVEQHKKLAGELHSNRLYHAAIEEYEKVLGYDGLDNKLRANINYLIGRIYYEDIRDYQNAAAYYLRAREYDPEGSFMEEASRNLVASLEKSGNVVDAKRQLDAATDIEDDESESGDIPVAKIDGRVVWLSEVEDQIATMPPEMQKQYTMRSARLELIRQYVGFKLVYDAALREDYLSRPEIQKEKEKLIERLLVDRFLYDKVVSQEFIDTLDVRNFYLVNKDSLYNGLPYDSVRARAFSDYRARKVEMAYADYVQQLVKAHNVQFLDDNVK